MRILKRLLTHVGPQKLVFRLHESLTFEKLKRETRVNQVIWLLAPNIPSESSNPEVQRVQRSKGQSNALETLHFVLRARWRIYIYILYIYVYIYIYICTPGSMNSLFSDFFRECWRGMLGGVRDYLGESLGDF